LTSMPKKIPCADADDPDAEYPDNEEETVDETLARCRRHLADLPPVIERQWRHVRQGAAEVAAAAASGGGSEGDDSTTSSSAEEEEEAAAAAAAVESVRVLQWNVLSQGKRNEW